MTYWMFAIYKYAFLVKIHYKNKKEINILEDFEFGILRYVFDGIGKFKSDRLFKKRKQLIILTISIILIYIIAGVVINLGNY